MRLDAFWSTERWHAYERAYGDPPGTRAQLLASATWKTRVIDLRAEEKMLWRDVRRSYHAIVNRLTRADADPNVFIVRFGPDFSASDDLDGPRNLHLLEAGRETRPIETWRIMKKWLEDGNAICAMAFNCSEPAYGVDRYSAIAYAYFAMYRNWAYYFSAASLCRDINHAMMWRTMQHLRSRGIDWLELGWQGHATDEKGKNIEFFRRGWGGVDMTFDTEV